MLRRTRSRRAWRAGGLAGWRAVDSCFSAVDEQAEQPLQEPSSARCRRLGGAAPPLPRSRVVGRLTAAPAAARTPPRPPQAVGRWAAISVSDNHAAGLTCEGHIYTWGANNRGQLGHGDKCPGVIDAPVQVSALSDMDIK